MRIQTKLRQRSLLGDYLNEWRIDRRYRRDAAKGYPLLLRIAERRLGYKPDIHNPKTFNEKVLFRKVYDRNPLLPIVCNKLTLSDYAAEKLGARAEALFPKKLGVFKRPRDIDLTALPDRFVLKANQASGWNIFVDNKADVDLDALRSEVTLWLRRSYGKKKQEWAYQSFQRCVIAEEFLDAPDGRALSDLKVYMLNGRVAFVHFIDGMIGDRSDAFMSEDWTAMGFCREGQENLVDPTPPAGLSEMLSLSRELSTDFDAIRVDFLLVGDRFYLGELTPYPLSGMQKFIPNGFDRTLGDMWDQPDYRKTLNQPT